MSTTTSSDMDAVVSTVQWVGLALGTGLFVTIGIVLFLCCRKQPADVDASALTDGLLRRDQLEGTELEGDEKGWQCVVCAYTNSPGRRVCLMCGANIDFLMSRTLKRHKSSKTVLMSAQSGELHLGESGSDAAAASQEDEEMRARQRAFVKRRLNALAARQSLSQRQRGAIRRRVWERKVLDDGKFHWIRQNSHDIALDELPLGPGAGSAPVLSTGNSFTAAVAPPPAAVALKGPGGESVVDYHNLRSQGYVSHYDELGRLTWKRADEVSIDLSSAEFKDSLVKDEKIDFEGVMALDFRRKKQWFLIHLSRIATPVTVAVAKLTISRDTIMEQTLQLAQAPSDAMRTYLKISFTGEPGIDAGGLLREWFGLVCKDVFSATRGFFIPTKGEDMSYWINPLSGEATTNHLQFFRLAGILVGKALFEGLVMDVHLALPLLKHVLGIPISFSDLEFLDDDLHRNCQWLRSNSNVDSLCLTFSVMLENGTEVDLKPGGRDIDVTDDNKEEYLQLVLEHRMLDSIAEQLQEFLTGLYDVVPKALLSVFDYQELELMLCGVPTIDMDDWQANAHVRYIKEEDNKKRKITTAAQDAVVAWFWSVVERMTPEERARLLQFATGTSRVPVEGFRGLTSSSGIIHQFTIQLVLRRDDAAALFPKAHTCFNRIDLPMYSSMEELERYLTIVSQMEILGFGLE